MRPFLLIILMSLSALLVISSTGIAAEKLPKKSVSENKSLSTGYCCIAGKLIHSNQKNCLLRKGHFFADQEEARKNCQKTTIKKDTGTLSLPTIKSTTSKDIKIKEVPLRKPGYCCYKGSVEKMFENECQGQDGSFFSSEAPAKRTCDHMVGYCCAEGEVSKLQNRLCSRRNGRFFTTPIEAKTFCDGTRGYCSVGGNVIPSVKRTCKQRGGDFFVNRWQAEKSRQDNSADSTSKGVSLEGQRKKTPHSPEPVKNRQTPLKTDKNMVLPAARLAPKPPDAPPETVPLHTERGINIVSPVGSEHFYQGESIYVVAQIIGEDFSAGMINFTVMNEASIVAGTASVAAAPLVSVSLPLRDDAPIGNYYVTASLEPDKYGSSDTFSIHRNSSRIDFLTPERTSTVHPGDSLDISYRLNARVEPGPITFDLYHSGTIVQSQTVDYTPGPPIRPARDSIYHLSWELSPDLPTDTRYTIMARHSRASGFSEPFNISDPIGFAEGDGTTVYHDLALNDVAIDPTHKVLTATIENIGDALNADVVFDVNLIIFGGTRTFEKHLTMEAGERQEVVLYRFDRETLNRYRDECGLPLSVTLHVPDWQRGIPDSDSYNNQIEKILYLPGGGVRITNSRLVISREGFGGGGTVENGGSLDWTRDLGIERRDSSATSTLRTSLTIKNCSARPFDYENPVIRATAHGTWSCGGGRLGDCEQEQRLWGPVPYHTSLEPGAETGIGISLASPHHVNLTIRITASANGSSDEFRFFLGFLD